MKTKILFIVFLLSSLITSYMNAQLEVQTSGDVLISKNLSIGKNLAIETELDTLVSLNIEHTSQSTFPYYGVFSHIKTTSSAPTGPVFGVYGFADIPDVTSTTVPITQSVGLYGRVLKPGRLTHRFSAGVAGVANYYTGIGVYGAIDFQLPTSAYGASYAGYFNGSVYINGTLFATNISTPSDLHQQENVQKIEPLMTDNIRLLNPVSYTLKQDTVWKYDVDAKELQSTHYGLIAQEVQKIYPELVYERGDKLSINYIELIPLLIMKVQELSTEVEALKKRLNMELAK